MGYIVLGMGFQGPAVAYGLSLLLPKKEIFCVEIDKAKLNRAKWLLGAKQLGADNVTFLKIDEFISPLDPLRKRSNMTVVSTLPYKLNIGIAEQCATLGWRYYDIGGHIQSSQKIAEIAKNKKSTVMTDLGLAPGLVNILAENFIKSLPRCVSLDMACGGLPTIEEEQAWNSELKYGLVFSPEGLINEYFNKCEILQCGHIVEVPPLLSEKLLGGDAYEMFVTSGGAHTTLQTVKKIGVNSCRYLTIRYPGHAKIIRFLKNDIGMTNEQLVELFKDKVPKIRKDKVVIFIEAQGKETKIGPYSRKNIHYTILSDDHFTAMQRATGFGAAWAVYATRNVVNKNVLAYGDIDLEKYRKELVKLLPELKT
jgi:saccharopine dehydrogenase-like NADP-dependent oxidoreductase